MPQSLAASGFGALLQCLMHKGVRDSALVGANITRVWFDKRVGVGKRYVFWQKILCLDLFLSSSWTELCNRSTWTWRKVGRFLNGLRPRCWGDFIQDTSLASAAAKKQRSLEQLKRIGRGELLHGRLRNDKKYISKNQKNLYMLSGSPSLLSRVKRLAAAFQLQVWWVHALTSAWPPWVRPWDHGKYPAGNLDIASRRCGEFCGWEAADVNPQITHVLTIRILIITNQRMNERKLWLCAEFLTLGFQDRGF